ncbi:MAG: helix-hairpin-helix domain-containing protein [Deltaproteobacteria bacterium]|nr:helix-hairpin-helix domain-containing protein [Deltaproteobacteria bacterium]
MPFGRCSMPLRWLQFVHRCNNFSSREGEYVMKGLRPFVKMLFSGMAMLLMMVAVTWASPLGQPFSNQGTSYGGAIGKSAPSVDKATPGKVRLPGEKINVNTASAAELSKLPGVGPKIAKEIVARRTTYGPFKSPRDLLEVKGIGKKVLSGMMDDIAF